MNCLTLLLWKSARNIFYIKGIFIKKNGGRILPLPFLQRVNEISCIKRLIFLQDKSRTIVSLLSNFSGTIHVFVMLYSTVYTVINHKKKEKIIIFYIICTV